MGNLVNLFEFPKIRLSSRRRAEFEAEENFLPSCCSQTPVAFPFLLLLEPAILDWERMITRIVAGLT
jgi:hypothetical protein